MAWIESHDDIWDHHKVYRLCAAVHQPDYAVIGRLHSLWHFVLRNAWRDANLEPWGDVVIEKASRWDGEKGVWVKALRDCGFLDGSVVHGWLERAGRLVQDRRRNEKKKGVRITYGKRTVSVRSPDELHRKPGATLPYPTLPNPTLPNPTLPNQVGVNGNAASKTAQSAFVEHFQEVYKTMTGVPYKAGKEHYIIAHRLIEDYGYELVAEKTKLLGVMCLNKSAWFTKDGWADFSIEKLSSFWNSILPDANHESSDQKSKRENEEIKKKVRNENERINSLMGRK